MKKNPSTFVKVAVKNKVLTRYNGVSIAVRLGKLKNLNIYVSQGSAATRLRWSTGMQCTNDLVANLVPNQTLETICQLDLICHSY